MTFVCSRKFFAIALIICPIVQAGLPINVTLEVSSETREFVATIENRSNGDVPLPMYDGVLSSLAIEIWSDETGVAAQPKSIQILSDEGVFAPAAIHVLKPREKWISRIKWNDLTAGLDESKLFLEAVFSTYVQMPKLVFARAFIYVESIRGDEIETRGARFESSRVPVFEKKKN